MTVAVAHLAQHKNVCLQKAAVVSESCL